MVYTPPALNKEQLNEQAVYHYRLDRLESIVEQLGKTVLASTELMERFAQRVDVLAVNIQHQGHQIQQQGYQLFALSDALQNVTDSQEKTQEQLQQVTQQLSDLIQVLRTS